jgi:DNA repair exonuclease SbcCD ATPase subunit
MREERGIMVERREPLKRLIGQLKKLLTDLEKLTKELERLGKALPEQESLRKARKPRRKPSGPAPE